jgi:hypothetical protein
VIDLAGHLLIDLAERPAEDRAATVTTFVDMARVAVSGSRAG